MLKATDQRVIIILNIIIGVNQQASKCTTRVVSRQQGVAGEKKCSKLCSSPSLLKLAPVLFQFLKVAPVEFRAEAEPGVGAEPEQGLELGLPLTFPFSLLSIADLLSNLSHPELKLNLEAGNFRRELAPRL